MTILRTMSGQSPKISQDEAISIADKLLGRDNSLSKSAGAVRCEVLTRPSSKISKSGTPEQDTMMYVLNYGNSDGYYCNNVFDTDKMYKDMGNNKFEHVQSTTPSRHYYNQNIEIITDICSRY